MLGSFRNLCAKHHFDQFYVDESSEVTYREFGARVETVLAQINEEGIRPGHVVVIKGEFSFHSIALLTALLINGNVVIPQTAGSMSKLADELALLHPDFMIVALAEPVAFERVGDSTGSCLAGLLPPGDPGMVVFSSGTTGLPKAIVHNARRLMDKFATRENKKVRAIPFLLFDHMGGFNTVLSIMLGGGCIIHCTDRRVDTICSAVQKFNVSLLPTTPTFLTMMLVSEAWKAYDLSSLRLVTYGTEVMNEAVLRKLVTVLPNIRFKQTYGLSEVGVLMTSSRGNETTWVKLTGDDLKTRVDEGILWLQVPSMMLGRVVFEGGDAQFVPHKSDWFCTNDMVDVDGEYFRFRGRVTDIISVSGLKVYPSEVENCMLDCPEVANVVVFGKKNPLVGQVVAAQVELMKDISDKPKAKASILARCRDRLERFKVPQDIQFVDAMEMSDRLKKMVASDA